MNDENNRFAENSKGNGTKRKSFSPFSICLLFNCSNIKINLFRLIIQLMLNSAFKDIQS